MTKSLQLAKAFLGKEVEVKIDRPLDSKHPTHDLIYEVNYGYVPGVMAPDGEELDAYYLNDGPVESAAGICIAIIHSLYDDDDKLIVAPKGKNYSDDEIKKLVDFVEKYFEYEILRG